MQQKDILTIWFNFLEENMYFFEMYMNRALLVIEEERINFQNETDK